MAYYNGMLAAVPTAKKDAYAEFARATAKVFRELGALELLEFWGDDVPDGKLNSMNSAVLRKDDETVVMSVIAWPSKEVHDAAYEKMREIEFPPMPFDGQRIIYGGFVPIDV